MRDTIDTISTGYIINSKCCEMGFSETTLHDNKDRVISDTFHGAMSLTIDDETGKVGIEDAGSMRGLASNGQVVSIMGIDGDPKVLTVEDENGECHAQYVRVGVHYTLTGRTLNPLRTATYFQRRKLLETIIHHND